MRVYIGKGKAEGAIIAPLSKSYMHRYILGGLLSHEPVKIFCDRSRAFPKDVSLTLGAAASFSHEVSLLGDGLTLSKGEKSSSAPLDCGESGSTLRFIIPSLLLVNGRAELLLSDRLQNRGIGVYEELFASKGIVIKQKPGSIEIVGELPSGDYTFSGASSSQYATGLLMALPLADGDSHIHLLPPVNSANYIDMTLDVLKQFGIKIKREGNDFCIPGNQTYAGGEYVCEGDYSGAAFLEALNLFDGKVDVKGLNPDSLQGDRAYRKLFPLLANSHAEIDISNCIDLGPILFSVSAILHGAKFKGVQRLRIKESDRLSDMLSELSKIGVSYRMDGEDGVEIFPAKADDVPQGIVFHSHNDHRLAMALSVIATRFGAYIEQAEAVSKSFPSFFDDLKCLGIRVSNDG
ncbi:MAG: 3-phosphoshikimate 1-carboxyvinyltransferase [Bacillota bacterium]|nr:3-phosphoshikimate 1-carboxyvinyltransferase [Bacillota bacterium]